MEKYIKKDAIVGEIERLQCPEHGYCLDTLLDFINTLEVKEVDLEKELDFAKDAYYYFTSDERSSMKKFAKYFFELGLKIQGE